MISISSKSLLDDVAAHMSTISEDMDLVPAPQAEQLKKAWAKVATDAKDYINILQRPISDLPGTSSTSAVESHHVITAKFNAIPKVPITGAKIHLYKLAATYVQTRYSICPRTLKPLWDQCCCQVNFPLLVNLPIYKCSHPSCSSADDKVLETVLGCAYHTTIDLFQRHLFMFNAYRPPVETQKRLEDLADTTGHVINQFNVRKYFLSLVRAMADHCHMIDSSSATIP